MEIIVKKELLKVVFRKFEDGEVIALFPEIKFGCPHYKIMSYMHVGQHGEVDYQAVTKITKLATKEDYQSLLKEIASIYHEYEIKVMKKLNVKW